MSNKYINAYYNDTVISDGDGSNPLTFGPLNATENQVSDPVKVDLKCNTGYKTVGDVTIGFTGTNASKFSVCATSDGEYTPSLTITDEVTETGISFYVKAKATEDEEPSNDTSVDITISSVIGAV